MFWGISEALDLYQEYIKAFKINVNDVAEGAASKVENVVKEVNTVLNQDKTEQSTTKVEELVELSEELQVKENNESKQAEENNEKSSENAANNGKGTNEARTTAGEDKELSKDENCENSSAKDSGPIQNENETAKIKKNLKEPVHYKEVKAPEELHILLFGCSDPRHILQTMAKVYTHKNENGEPPKLHFYMLDGCIEITARSIALLAIALEQPIHLSLLAKTHLFMDVYGNALMRPSSYEYLAGKAKSMLKMICDPDLLNQLAPMLDLEMLKYRERDGLEQAFDFWSPKPDNVFDIKTYWDNRNRKLLSTRYDYRKGVFDWDLNMTLKDRQGQQICGQEYRYWRETGIAFTFPEYEQCMSNKTLCAGLVRNGPKYSHRGYLGDIQTGPFCAFGLKTHDTSMLHSAHGENDYRATDITERNLLELFHEIQAQTPYSHDVELSRKFGAVRLQMCQRLTCNEMISDELQSYDDPWINVEGVEIHILDMDEIGTMKLPGNRWKNHFDVIFLGQNYFSLVTNHLAKILKPHALLIMETKLMSVLRREVVAEFEQKLKNFAMSAKLKPVINYNAFNTKYSLLKYKKQPLNKESSE